MRKVHQAKSHVVYVYWMDTVYVENNLPSDKALWRFDRVYAYFSDASQNFPMHKISLVTFWMGCLMY